MMINFNNGSHNAMMAVISKDQASQAAEAVNALMRIDSEVDQEALLEV